MTPKDIGRPTKYKDTYPSELITLMSQGQLDAEVYSTWNIGKSTFYEWLNEIPELKEAHEIGKAKSLTWWMTEGRKRFMEQGDKGHKYWISVMNNVFGWKDKVETVTNNLTINQQNNIQLIDSQEKYLQALDDLRTTAKELNVIDILPIELQKDDVESSSSEDSQQSSS